MSQLTEQDVMETAGAIEWDGVANRWRRDDARTSEDGAVQDGAVKCLAPLEMGPMNKCVTGSEVKTTKAPVVREESVDLVRQVRAQLQHPDPAREGRVNELHAQIKGSAYDVAGETIAADIMEALERARQEGA